MSQIEPGPKSSNTPRPSGRRPMEAVAQEITPDPPKTIPLSPQTTILDQIPARTLASPAAESWYAGVLGTVNVLAMLLAGRLIALVAVAGAIALTWRALEQGDVQLIQWRLIALGIYVFGVCPIVVFYSLRSSPSR